MLPDFLFQSDIALFILIGFLAQLVDGALGMAYGTLSTSILMAMGIPPVTASASVHTAQMFTAGASAASHAWFKNINWRWMMPLALFGSIGGIIGVSYLLSIDGAAIKPFIFAYLAALGVYMLIKLWRKKNMHRMPGGGQAGVADPGRTYHSCLGFIGGVLDAVGGGGWGPVVTSNLMVKTDDPRRVIGTVNAAEFFVKTTISFAFMVGAGFHFTEVVAGLLIGGVIAAPFGALILKKIKPEPLMVAVAGVIILISTGSLFHLLVSS